MSALSNNVKIPAPPAVWDLSETQRPEPVSLLPRIDLEEVFNALLRRLWLIVGCVMVAVLGMAFYISRQPTLYASMGAVYVKTQAPRLFDIAPISQEEARDLDQMRTVEQGMLSSTLLLKLVEKHGLAEDPIFAKGGVSQQALLQTMRSRVTVELRRGTRLIDVTVEDTDPQRAATLVEDLVKEYEIWKDGGRNELVAKASAGLASEEERLREKVEASEARLQQFRIENPLPGLASGTDYSSSELGMMSRELTTARTERMRLESEYEAFKQFDPADPDSIAGLTSGEHTGLVITLLQQIGDKKAEFARVKQRYLHKHPVYIESADEIARLEKSLEEVCLTAGNGLKKRYDVAVEQQAKLEALVGNATGSAVGAETVRDAFGNLNREVEVNRELHASVAKRLQETQIGSSLTSSFLRWDEKPFAADWPSAPRAKVLLAASLAVGGMLGLLLALGAELLDRRVRESGAVSRAIDLPLLGSMPNLTPEAVAQLEVTGENVPERGRPMHLTGFVGTPDQAGEGPGSLLFTSAFKGDGKSLSALKCARMLARQGHRTLLVDASLDDAGLSGDFHDKRHERHGLAAYLLEEAGPADVFYETGLRGLWFLPSGAGQGDNSELLSLPKFRELLESLAPMFDKIVIDGTGVIGAQPIARHIDSTCLVVRRNVGRYRDLKEAAAVLRSAGANLSGFVWNEVEDSSRGGKLPQVCSPAGHGRIATNGDADHLVALG